MKQQTLNIQSALLIGSLISGGAAFGMDIDPRFYMGIDGEYNHSKIPNTLEEPNYRMAVQGSSLFKKSGSGIGAFLGLSLSEYFGIEAGYTQFASKKTDVQVPPVRRFLLPPGNVTINKLTLKQHNIYGDILGYFPMSDDVKLVGALGIGLLSSKYKDTPLFNVLPSLSKTYKKSGIRVGLGTQFAISENSGARLMARHQKGNKMVKNMTSLALGLFYQF